MEIRAFFWVCGYGYVPRFVIPAAFLSRNPAFFQGLPDPVFLRGDGPEIRKFKSKMKNYVSEQYNSVTWRYSSKFCRTVVQPINKNLFRIYVLLG